MTFHVFSWLFLLPKSKRPTPQTFGPRDPGQRPTKAQGTKATKATAQAAQAEARLTTFFLVGHNGPGLRLGGWPDGHGQFEQKFTLYIIYINIYIYKLYYIYVCIYKQ